MPFLIPRVQDGYFPQPANTFRADNLGILCVWYTYHIAAQLPWCASNIYLKKKKKPQTLLNLFPPQLSLLKLLTSPSVGNLQDADLFVYSFIFGSITLTASKEGGEDGWENNLQTFITALPRRAGTVFTPEPPCAAQVMNRHIPPQSWSRFGNPATICILLAWGCLYFCRGQGAKIHLQLRLFKVRLTKAHQELGFLTIFELLLLCKLLNIEHQNLTIWAVISSRI